MTVLSPKAIVLATVVALTAGAASAATLGERVDSGALSPAAFEQLIAGTGLSLDAARQLTLDEVVAIRWQDD